MELSENIKCLKCFSLNSSAMNYCRYCHQRFNRASNLSAESDEKETFGNKKLIVAGSSLLILAIGYLVFKQ